MCFQSPLRLLFLVVNNCLLQYLVCEGVCQFLCTSGGFCALFIVFLCPVAKASPPPLGKTQPSCPKYLLCLSLLSCITHLDDGHRIAKQWN